MAVSTESRLNPPALAAPMTRGRDAFHQAAALLLLTQAALWAFLLFRWATFSRFNWTPYRAELVLAEWPPLVAYGLYGLLLVWALAAGVGLWRGARWGQRAGLAYAVVTLLGALGYYALGREFIGAVLVVAAGGLLLCLLTRNAAWSLAFPSAFWLVVFFLAPLAIVFVVSLGERTRLGTVTYLSLIHISEPTRPY